MPKRNADVLEVLISQMSEYRNIYFVISKTLRVLGQAELEPSCDLLHRHALSALDQQKKKSTRARPGNGALLGVTYARPRGSATNVAVRGRTILISVYSPGWVSTSIDPECCLTMMS